MKVHTIIPQTAQEHYLNSNIYQGLNVNRRAPMITHVTENQATILGINLSFPVIYPVKTTKTVLEFAAFLLYTIDNLINWGFGLISLTTSP